MHAIRLSIDKLDIYKYNKYEKNIFKYYKLSLFITVIL